MEETKYKVEIFITPKINKCEQDDSINEIDDVKVANILKSNGVATSSEDNTKVCPSKETFDVESDFIKDKELDNIVNENLQNEMNFAVLKNDKVYESENLSDYSSVNEKINFHKTFNENILNNLIHDSIIKKTQAQKKNKWLDSNCAPDDLKKQNQNGHYSYDRKLQSREKHDAIHDSALPSISKRNELYDVFFPAKSLKRFNSLMSIDEQNEDSEENSNDFCLHGYKNGCTASIPTPQEVSHDIFKENWLRKLETLRQKEALLRDKEISLQNRERSLFTREKQLRILERNVKDKVRQVELHLKTCKCLQNPLGANMENERIMESRSSNEFQELIVKDNESVKSNESKENVKGSVELCEKQKQDTTESGNVLPVNHGKMIRNPPNSRSSLTSSINTNNHFGKHSSYSSFKCKPRPKISYDDLDSTLSADIGDASFVVTSRKFDPKVFKKPVAFRRSASERRTKQNTNDLTSAQFISSTLSKEEQHQHITEERILKRFSENILVSQDHSTRFQDYGLIDRNIDNVSDGRTKKDQLTAPEEKRCSYLNLESTAQKLPRNNAARQKGRPISWNEETDEWLLKKRHAYNLMTKKVQSECSDNKENLGHPLKDDKLQKMVKKKDKGKAKILSIFR